MGRAYQNRKDSMAKTSDMKARVYSKSTYEYRPRADGWVRLKGDIRLSLQSNLFYERRLIGGWVIFFDAPSLG